MSRVVFRSAEDVAPRVRVILASGEEGSLSSQRSLAVFLASRARV